MANAANVAAQIMEHGCTCPLHGYSQPGRYGTGSGFCMIETEAGTIEYAKGDRDCSSGDCESWELALSKCFGQNFGINRYNSTYTMRYLFEASGLFEVKDMSFTAQRGDLYLNDSAHTAMCVDDGSGSYGYDALAEWSIAETGGIDGEPGDQTGAESSIHGYYDYPWSCILHYKGDSSGNQDNAFDFNESIPIPEYRIFTREDGWLDWMVGLKCQCDQYGCDDDYAGIEGHWAYDFQCNNLGKDGWYKIIRADGSETMNSSGNTDSPIVGLEVYYDTDTSSTGGVYYKAKYRAHWLGVEPGWGKYEYDDEDSGAGKDAQSPIDLFQLTIEKA